MSATVSSRAETSLSEGSGSSCLELVRLSPRWGASLERFLQTLRECGDAKFFAPHSMDGETIKQLAGQNGRDLYYLLVEEESVLGYGLLRGWDEGFHIPSLGIAVHPSVRGHGIGKVLMSFLHVAASRRGASRVRLRVLKENGKAIALYRSFGYVFEDAANNAEYLIGFKNL